MLGLLSVSQWLLEKGAHCEPCDYLEVIEETMNYVGGSADGTAALEVGRWALQCGGCALRCGEAGHRRCPVCRAPHLLHPARLAQRSAVWRSRYASWRVGGHAGACGELSSIRVPAPFSELRAEAGGGLEAGGSVHGSVGHSRACGDVHRAGVGVSTFSAPDLVKLGEQ